MFRQILLSGLVFLVIKITKNIPFMFKKSYEERPVDLLLQREEGKGHYVTLKDFNTFMYDHTLHCQKKTFLPFLLPSFQYRRNIKRSY